MELITKAHSSHNRPDIDGLRALAVLPVLLFHAKLGCPGGFVGVDIFFVISGYLISSLILKELDADSFSLKTFWERRIRRILPALMVVVLATLIAAWFLFLPKDFIAVSKSAMAQAALVSNVFFYLQRSSYFDAGLDTYPLLHTWSLAVEEQFYLFFPLVLLFFARYRRLYLAKTLTTLTVGSFVLSVWCSYTHPVAAFYLLPTRAWELFLGALLTTMRGRFSVTGPMKEATGALGLSLVCYSIFFYNGDIRFPGLAAIPPCFGAACIIFSSESNHSTVGRILEFKPVVFIGLISYSLYLWHWPLLVFSNYQTEAGQNSEIRAILLLASIALAILTWKYIEQPFRRRVLLKKRSHLFGFAGASMSMLLLLGLFVYFQHGVPSRFSTTVLNYANSPEHNAFMHNANLEQALAGRFAEIGSKATNSSISILIWGDSHAMSVTPALDELCHQFSQRGIQATYSATAPVLGYDSPGIYSLGERSPIFANAVLSLIVERHIKNVIIVARWSYYPASDAFKSKLLSTVKAIMASGAKVYIMKDYPNPGFDVPRVTAVFAMHNADLNQLGITREKYQLTNRALRPTFVQIAQMGATVLDPAKYFLNRDGLYGVIQNGQILYIDGDHLTGEGARLLVPLFDPIFRSN